MRILLCIILFIFCALSVKGQNTSVLKGRFLLNEEQEIDMCTIVLLLPDDSSLIAGGTFSSKKFEFTKLEPKPYILSVRDMLYESYDTLICLQPGINTLDISLVSRMVELDDVIVSARRTAIMMKRGNVFLDVRNSYLKDEMKLSSVLAKIPGVLVNADGAVSMFGKKGIAIYIDGKEIVSEEMLKLLQPSDIDKIEVFNHPGAAYGSNIQAVIKIETYKKWKDDVRISLTTGVTRGRKWGGDNLFNLLISKKKWSHYVTYSNWLADGRTLTEESVYNFLDTYTSMNQRNTISNSKIRRHNLYYSFLCDLTKKQTIGFQYSGLFNNFDRQTDVDQLILQDQTITDRRNLDGIFNSEKHLHDFSLNYKNQLSEKNTFTLLGGFVLSGSDEYNAVEDRAIERDEMRLNRTNSANDYKIYSIKTDFTHHADKWNIDVGGHYSDMRLKSQIDYYSGVSENELYDMNEHLAALYVNLNCNFGFISGSAGVRGEYANTSLRLSKDKQEESRTYWNVFPYISVSKGIVKNMELTASYRKYFDRPSFSMWSPLSLYCDSLSYITGNPDMKPMSGDLFSLDLSWSKFYIGCGYSIYYNYYLSEEIQDRERPQVVIERFGNSKNKMRVLSGYASYTYAHKIMSIIASVNIDKPYFVIPYRGSTLSLNTPIWLFKLSTDVNLTKSTTLNADFFYTTKGNSLNYAYKPYGKLSLTVNQYFFDKKLLLSLCANDIFHTNKERVTTYNPHVCKIKEDNPNSRTLSLTIRYQFGFSEKQIRKESPNTESVNRM